MVKKDLQKYVNEEAELQKGLSAIHEYAGTNSKEELAAKLAIGTVATKYHPVPSLEAYVSQDAGFVMSAGRALLEDAQRGIVNTAKSDLEATVSLLSEKDLPGITADVVTPSDKKDERHEAHRKYLEVRNEMVNKKGEVDIIKYLALFNDDSAYSSFIRRISAQEAKTKDGKKIMVPTKIGQELVQDYIGTYKREFLMSFVDKDGKQIDPKELSKYTVENLNVLPEGKPKEAQLKDSIVYTIVETAVKPEKEKDNIVEFPKDKEELAKVA
ncbi:hypothetical protein AUJ62_02170 [Candidatus Pacearchaeota archaeon CG1_02_32_21]|nr:MAG: hypothetical protein AUJ62_02170 [Candidatus Pacearchaeota archaeon CG1_02_32_21]